MNTQATQPEPLDEGVLAFIFGDEEVDPGHLVTEGAKTPGFVARLDAIAHDVTALKAATGKRAADSEALARLRVLRDETVAWQARAATTSTTATAPASTTNVVDFAAARQKRASRAPVYVGIVLAAAAAVLLVVRPWAPGAKTGSAPPEVTASLVGPLMQGVGENTGHGFGGPLGPSPHDRGFLLGGILDLAQPSPGGAPRASADRALLDSLVDRALLGLDAPEVPAERLLRARGGCSALIEDAKDRAACEAGMADYRARRDAALVP